MDDLSKIFAGKDKVDEDQLRKYLKDELSEEEKHAVEEAMTDSPFINDALEGLQQIPSEKKREELVSQINNSLQKNLKNRKDRRRSWKIKNIWWIILTVILILLLCVLSILLIRWFKEKELSPQLGLVPAATTSIANSTAKVNETVSFFN